jgi:hypothetical protein
MAAQGKVSWLTIVAANLDVIPGVMLLVMSI